MKKLLLIAMVFMLLFQMSACVDDFDKETKEDVVQNTESYKNDENTEKDIEVVDDFGADDFFDKLKGYWGTDNDPYDSWDVFGFVDDKVTLFTYPGEYWIEDGVIDSVKKEDDGTIVAKINYVYYEMGSDISSDETLEISIKSDNDYKESIDIIIGDRVTKYVYMGETFEQSKMYADTH